MYSGGVVVVAAGPVVRRLSRASLASLTFVSVKMHERCAALHVCFSRTSCREQLDNRVKYNIHEPSGK